MPTLRVVLALEAEVRTACEAVIGQLWASDSSDRDQVECGSADAPDAAAKGDLGAALDAWNYSELVGLHAIADLWRRVGQIARFRQDVTRPDYSTCQPWAVFAFLRSLQTTMFGEQQLHDAQTNIHLEAGAPGVVCGLLLADAAHALAMAQGMDA